MPLEYNPDDPPRNYDGSIMTLIQFNQAMRDLERRRAAHKRYRQTEKYKEKRREYDKERRKRRALLLLQAKEYLNRDKPKFAPRDLTERQKEEKRRYNLDRYHRLKMRREQVRKQVVQEKIKSGEWGNLRPHLITKDSPPEPSEPRGSVFVDGVETWNNFKPKHSIVASFGPRPGSKVYRRRKPPEAYNLTDPEIVENLREMYPWALPIFDLPEDEKDDLRVEHEAWYAVREELSTLIRSARDEKRPLTEEEVERFRFQPVHRDDGDPHCSYCRAKFDTPVGRRKSAPRDEWNKSPYNCHLLEDIPNMVFWPGEKE